MTTVLPTWWCVSGTWRAGPGESPRPLLPARARPALRDPGGSSALSRSAGRRATRRGGEGRSRPAARRFAERSGYSRAHTRRGRAGEARMAGCRVRSRRRGRRAPPPAEGPPRAASAAWARWPARSGGRARTTARRGQRRDREGRFAGPGRKHAGQPRRSHTRGRVTGRRRCSRWPLLPPRVADIERVTASCLQQ